MPAHVHGASDGQLLLGAEADQANRAPAIPAWIVSGNGRLEADPIDISTKFAGRIAELRVDEGDRVTSGQVVAVIAVWLIVYLLRSSGINLF